MVNKSKSPESAPAETHYMIQAGNDLVFYRRTGPTEFKEAGRIDLGPHASGFYNAARKKKLRFFL